MIAARAGRSIPREISNRLLHCSFSILISSSDLFDLVLLLEGDLGRHVATEGAVPAITITSPSSASELRMLTITGTSLVTSAGGTGVDILAKLVWLFVALSETWVRVTGDYEINQWVSSSNADIGSHKSELVVTDISRPFNSIR